MAGGPGSSSSQQPPPFSCPRVHTPSDDFCPSHSIQERTLAFSPKIEVRQVRFHPGSKDDNHICLLTNDNIFRVYVVENGKVQQHGIYQVGPPITGKMINTQISVQEVFGETAEDFDFAPPQVPNAKRYHQSLNNTMEDKHLSQDKSVNNEKQLSQGRQLNNEKQLSQQERQLKQDGQLNQEKQQSKAKQLSSEKQLIRDKFEEKQLINNKQKNKEQPISREKLRWPIYFLTGDGCITIATISLHGSRDMRLMGPFGIDPLPEKIYNGFCSILVIPSTPVIVAVATIKGRLFHVLVLDANDHQDDYDDCKQFILWENVELELSFSKNTRLAVDSTCPMYLHRDDAKLGNYFTTHDGGVHSISVTGVESLHKFLNAEADGVDEEEVLQEFTTNASIVEYLLCTKANEREIDAVIGFALYHNPHSFLALLGSGQLVTLAILTMLLPQSDPNDLDADDLGAMSSPLKSMLSNPFDAQIQRILRSSGSQPILKLPKDGQPKTQQECYEIFQRAATVFREEHFRQHERAREEIQKRVKALNMLKEFQSKEIARMLREKGALQERTENLAVKYEELKDRQEEFRTRCEQLMILIAKRQSVPSNAERSYHETLKQLELKLERYKVAVTKLRSKMKYQEVQMSNYKAQTAKNMALSAPQSENIKATLREMTKKIAHLVKEVGEYKAQLNVH